MRFWDSSTIVPLCTNETWSKRLKLMVQEDRARARVLAREWSFVRPSVAVRDLAKRLLRVHPLRAGDALRDPPAGSASGSGLAFVA